MRKRRLTHGQQLRKMQKEAAPDSALSRELEALRIAIEKPRNKAIAELIKLLKSSLQRETQWFIGKVFSTAKDERVIKPLIRAAQAPENENYSSNFIWPLEKYDCTRYLDFFVKFMLESEDPNESVLACSYVIEAMKGPFKPIVVKKNIRKLLGKSKPQAEPDMELMAEHFRMSAADALMSKYFLQVAKEFHGTNGKKGH
ncbi:hypothetical protein ACVWYF_001786 [Hymenobacter sp. UYAg731]